MPSYLTTPLQRFGLLNEQLATPQRIFSEDASDESSAEIRQVPDRNTDTEGETIFSSFRSVVELAAYDLNIERAQQWMTAQDAVTLVATTPDAIIQWTEPTRLTTRPLLTPEEAALVEAEYALVRDAGNEDTHGVYLTRNALLPLGVSGAFSQQIDWPLDGSTVTLSATDADTLSITALGAGGGTLASDSINPGSGRAGLDFTTPADTYFLDLEVAGTSAADPALRVDGSQQFVPK
jgi:hypothetical protein